MELTMSYADRLADDLWAFSQHRKGKTVTHEDVLLVGLYKLNPVHP
jgi:histone H3/H4